MPRKPKCRVCKREFDRKYTTTQKTCSIACAIKDENTRKTAQNALRRDIAKKTRKDRDKLKSRADWLREAQTAFNAYIRERDKNEPCISCGTTSKTIQYCAGHYLTRGAHPELRFHEFNVHKQCNKRCNLMKSGNIAEYRPRLIDKIGNKAVEWLESYHKPQHFTIEDAKEIKEHYKEQLRILKNGM